MSEDTDREPDELDQDGELLPNREVMSTVRIDPEPVFLEPDPKTYEEQWSPEDPPPGT